MSKKLYKIREVTKANVEAAIGLACSVFEQCDHQAIRAELLSSIGDTDTTSCVSRDLGITSSKYFMATIKGQPAALSGYYSYVEHEEDMWLGWTCASPEFKGLGLGEAIISHAFYSGAKRDIKSFRIWTSDEPKFAAARQLYKKLGFNEESYGDDSPGERTARVFSRAVNNTVMEPWRKIRYCLPDLLADLPRLENTLSLNNN